MIVHEFDPPPKEYDYHGSTGMNIDAEQQEEGGILAGIDEIWYWYSYGNYEGSGEMLLRKGNEWDLWSLSHCS